MTISANNRVGEADADAVKTEVAEPESAAPGTAHESSPESENLKLQLGEAESLSESAIHQKSVDTQSLADLTIQQDNYDNLPPATLALNNSYLQRYPVLQSTLIASLYVALQMLSSPTWLADCTVYSIFWIWVFYYVLGKSPLILELLPGYRHKFLQKGIMHQSTYLTLAPSGMEWHSAHKPRGRNVVPWSSIHLVGAKKTRFFVPGRSGTSLVLNCDEMPDYEIRLSRLDSLQIEQLFRWLSRKVPQTRLSSEALYLQMQSLYGDHSASIESFTEMWSEDFDRRFELANHVCLSPGQPCGNNRYRIEMVVATKINSSVYLVTDSAGTRFILKELVVPVGTEDSLQVKMLEQFSREANLLTQISHESIVRVLDHFVENGRSYMVLDCVQGSNLRQYVRKNGNLSESEVIAIAKQISDVLNYLSCHNPPIIHRDLTPDNIVYDESSGKIAVVDFGAANVYATEGTGTLIGKQGYMPPEQFKGKTTPASDVYAFGSTLLFLLTGADPPGMGRMPETLATIGPELLQLIQECLDLDSSRRPTSEDLIGRFAHLEKNIKEN